MSVTCRQPTVLAKAISSIHPPGLASLLSSRQLKRSYFSIHHPDPPPFPQTQDRILSAAYDRVPEHGFTSKSLILGAQDAGYLDVTIQLFPRGAFDLINYHLVTQRMALKNNVQFPESARLGLGAKVRTLAMARLRANRTIIHQWQGVWSLYFHLETYLLTIF